MRVLGLDPSLTNFGWAVHDSDAEGKARCVARGRFQTKASGLFVRRFMDMRTSLRDVVLETKPDRVGIESPIFHSDYSEGMYALFVYCCEALLELRQDVVFWSPLQSKAHARELLERPPGWKMQKPDMVEAAKADTGGRGAWNHNEADAYHCARLSARFWLFLDGTLPEAGLTPVEAKYFLEIKQFKRGKRAGQVLERGVVFRENERFFRWSNGDDDGEGDGKGDEG